LSAAKRINELCEELDIPLQNPGIYWIPSQQYQAKENTSQYKGVCWHKESKQWRVHLNLRGEKTRNGGYFKDELDAAKRVNQLCEEMGIPLKNPGMSTIPTQQYRYKAKAKTSQYKGVYFHKQSGKWRVQLKLKGQQKCGGYFDHELDAGKRMNQLCEEFGIPLRNPELSAVPNEQHEKKEKASQYKGVCWNKAAKRWYALICRKGQKQKYGGSFKDELDAAKRVNQLCKELGISLQNPEISEIPNQKYEHDDCQTIANPVIVSQISQIDNDDASKKKRKPGKEYNDDACDQFYFYDKFLK
jgi:hypothetical protein